MIADFRWPAAIRSAVVVPQLPYQHDPEIFFRLENLGRFPEGQYLVEFRKIFGNQGIFVAVAFQIGIRQLFDFLLGFGRIGFQRIVQFFQILHGGLSCMGPFFPALIIQRPEFGRFFGRQFEFFAVVTMQTSMPRIFSTWS